jgi:hypothetical protein
MNWKQLRNIKFNHCKLKAEKEKQAFINVLNIDFNDKVVQSFRTIENNWLLSIKTLNDFEQFLNITDKKI